jgi:dihydropyrimidinase
LKDLLIHNAKVCLPEEIINSNVWIKDGVIHKIGIDKKEPEDVERIDAQGNYLLPGFIDVHTHLDDVIGGYNLADTYSSGTAIALLNGITTLYSFVTQGEDESISESINTTKKKANGKIFCNVGWHVTPTNYTKDNLTELEDLLRKGLKTIKLYTTYKEAGIYSSYKQIKKLAEIVKQYNAAIMVHCEDEEVIMESSGNNYDLTNSFSHTLMRPKEAEIKAVENIIDIAKETGARFHIVHVSSPEPIDLIKQAGSEVKITSETGPQYLILNDIFLKGESGYQYLCTPPLRDEFSQLSLYEKTINNEIDIYATDHCAFTKMEKSKNKNDITMVPKGLPGIGALVPLVYGINKYKGKECFLHMAKHLSENPAKLTGIFPKKGIIKEGSDADLVLVTEGKNMNVKATLNDSYDPYEGYETDLNILKVILKGETVVNENALINRELPKGKII